MNRFLAAAVALVLGRRQQPDIPPPVPPLPPIVEAIDEIPPLLAGTLPRQLPPGVGRYTPVWMPWEAKGMLVHRLAGDGHRTPEGFLIVAGPGCKFGHTMPAAMALVIWHANFCGECWPRVPVIPGRDLPRRR